MAAIDLDMSDLCSGHTYPRPLPKRGPVHDKWCKVATWLTTELHEPLPANEVLSRLREVGIDVSARTARRVYADLDGRPRKAGFQEGWVWDPLETPAAQKSRNQAVSPEGDKFLDKVSTSVPQDGVENPSEPASDKDVLEGDKFRSPAKGTSFETTPRKASNGAGSPEGATDSPTSRRKGIGTKYLRHVHEIGEEGGEMEAGERVNAREEAEAAVPSDAEAVLEQAAYIVGWIGFADARRCPCGAELEREREGERHCSPRCYWQFAQQEVA